MVLNILLTEKTQGLDTVNVFGKLDKESEAASRSSEKNADNIINVVGAKTILGSNLI